MAVDTFFDRISPAFPTYVARRHARLEALKVLAITLGLGMICAAIVRYNMRKSGSLRYTYVIAILAFVWLSIFLYDKVFDYVFLVDNIEKNSQHYINVFWLRKYVSSFVQGLRG